MDRQHAVPDLMKLMKGNAEDGEEGDKEEERDGRKAVVRANEQWRQARVDEYAKHGLISYHGSRCKRLTSLQTLSLSALMRLTSEV